MMEERMELSIGRIKEIEAEAVVKEPFGAYFKEVAGFILQMVDLYKEVEAGRLQSDGMEALQERNARLYADILPDHYSLSYGAPEFAAARLGAEFGSFFSFLYVEMRSMIEYAFEQKQEELLIRLELFLEIYHAFYSAYEEEGKAPAYGVVKDILYWFVSDYAEPEEEQRVREQVNPAEDFAVRIIMDSDLRDLRYLYRFGEYITDCEIRTAKHLNAMTEERIRFLADTYTEGYRIGFQVGNKDLSKKKTVNIRYCLGFERMIRQAIVNFREMGLEPVIYRAGGSIFRKKGNKRIGYYGAIANKQYEYDHKEDEALFLDKLLVNRRIETLQEAYEKEKEWAALFGGPAVVEIFGEKPFSPVSKPEVNRLSPAQQQLSVTYASAAGGIVDSYIKGEERSFTIIAFPGPEIGDAYETIFDEVVKINTLDYKVYQNIQQTIIDTLDLAAHVVVKGWKERGNETDLVVKLRSLSDGRKETVFENCVADVNIPVGEVFTSPRLEGTNGVLQVNQVFLNELEYRKLEIRLKDGMVEAYSCANFPEEEENKKYVKDNLLMHHDTLPLGEFAIGTNTTAYVAARKYHIADTLPILIAEKMGPHFALGDTCYSHSEDVRIFNPDGKEIVAKDNSVSARRKENPEKAYFNCHTDITIPYDELALLAAVTADGEEIPIIQYGRFVLEGCQDLNLPFAELEEEV